MKITEIIDSIIAKVNSNTVHRGKTDNPHSVTKTQVGLANVDNTSDASKPVSTAQQTALNLKANSASPTFTGTVSGITKSMVGLALADNTADSAKNVLSATKLTTARTIGGVSFDGTDSINLAGVNIAGNQSTTGNAATATKWATARTITLNGDLTGSVSIDGSANVTLSATVAANSVALGTDTTGNYVAGNTAGTGIVVSGTAGEGWSPTITLSNVGTSGTYRSVTTDAQGRITAGTNPTTVAGYGLTDVYTKTEVDTNIGVAVSSLVDSSPSTLDTLNELAAALGDDPNFATTVTNNIGTKVTANTAIVAGTGTKVTYDTKGLVTSSTILAATDIPSLDVSKLTTGTLSVARGGTGVTTSTGTGNAVLSTSPVLTTPNIGTATGSVSGNSGTTTKLATARSITASGDVVWTANFDGSSNVTAAATLANSGITAGTYKSVTVDTKGRATAGTVLTADKELSGLNIANMLYTDGNLTKIRYTADTDTDYEVLGYTSGNLSSINHYIGSVLKGTTTLSYTDGNLVSAIFVGV